MEDSNKQFYQKYLIYKNKYLNLKKQLAGSNDILNCNDFKGLTNSLGTCWNIAIQSILYYGDKTSDELQCTLINKSIDEIYLNALPYLKVFLPPHIFDENKNITKVNEQRIKKIIEISKRRFKIQIADSQESFTDFLKIVNERRQSESICEKEFTDNFFELLYFDKFNNNDYFEDSDYGGDDFDDILMLNLLTVLFLNKFSKFTFYTDESSYDKIIENIENSIGILFDTKNHEVGFYNCNGKYVYVNNDSIVDFDIKNYFIQLENKNKKKSKKYIPAIAKFGESKIVIISEKTLKKFPKKFNEIILIKTINFNQNMWEENKVKTFYELFYFREKRLNLRNTFEYSKKLGIKNIEIDGNLISNCNNGCNRNE